MICEELGDVRSFHTRSSLCIHQVPKVMENFSGGEFSLGTAQIPSTRFRGFGRFDPKIRFMVRITEKF